MKSVNLLLVMLAVLAMGLVMNTRVFADSAAGAVIAEANAQDAVEFEDADDDAKVEEKAGDQKEEVADQEEEADDEGDKDAPAAEDTDDEGDKEAPAAEDKDDDSDKEEPAAEDEGSDEGEEAQPEDAGE